MKTAFITGITGQCGSFLSEILLDKGYRVYGMARRLSAPNDWRIKHLKDNSNFLVVQGDLTDPFSVRKLILQYQPDEVYNLAAQSFVKCSFDEPFHTTNVDYIGVLNLLEAMKSLYAIKQVKLFQASSSEMFGSCFSIEDGSGRYECHNANQHKEEYDDSTPFQDELTPMLPNSPYAVAKLAAHNLCRIYRDAYGMFVSCGIMFNMESERRGEEFVTKKIARYAARHKEGLESKPLVLGNLNAKRDWSYCKDTMMGVWMMLQANNPNNYVLATNKVHSVADFVTECANYLDIEFPVETSDQLLRPCEVPYLKGSYSKIEKDLGWRPQTSFEDLVKTMVNNELQKAM